MTYSCRLAVAIATLLLGLASAATHGADPDAGVAGDNPSTDPVREAEEALLGAIERSAALGDAANLAANLRNLGFFYQTQGRYAEARTLHERAFAVRERALGRNHADVIQSLEDLAMLDVAEGHLASATEQYERALRAQRKLYGRRAPQTAITINNLARIQATRGDYRRAAALYGDELAILEAAHGPESMRLVSTLETLASLDVRLGRPTAAEALYGRAIVIAEVSDAPASQRRLLELLEGYAQLLEALPERQADYTAIAERAAALRATNPGMDRRPERK